MTLRRLEAKLPVTLEKRRFVEWFARENGWQLPPNMIADSGQTEISAVEN